MLLEGVIPKWVHRIWKARMKAQLLGCSWQGETFRMVRSSFSKVLKGSRKPSFSNTVTYIKVNF